MEANLNGTAPSPAMVWEPCKGQQVRVKHSCTVVGCKEKHKSLPYHGPKPPGAVEMSGVTLFLMEISPWHLENSCMCNNFTSEGRYGAPSAAQELLWIIIYSHQRMSRPSRLLQVKKQFIFWQLWLTPSCLPNTTQRLSHTCNVTGWGQYGSRSFSNMCCIEVFGLEAFFFFFVMILVVEVQPSSKLRTPAELTGDALGCCLCG